jgi:hypothetical protein
MSASALPFDSVVTRSAARADTFKFQRSPGDNRHSERGEAP